MIASELDLLTPHVYWLPPKKETCRPALGAISGQQSLLMVDAGNSPVHASAFLEGLHRCILPVPSYLFLTHWRWDHVFGSSIVEALLVASNHTGDHLRETARLDWRDKALDQRVEDNLEMDFYRNCLKAEMSNVERGRIKLRLPDIAFSQSMDIVLENITCRLIALGDEQTAEASFLYVPEDAVVFLGESLGGSLSSARHFTTPERFTRMLDKILEVPAELFVDSHRSKPLSRIDLEKEVAMIKEIAKAARAGQGNRTAAVSQLKQNLGASSLPQNTDFYLDVFLGGMRQAAGE